jgi:hypothetical protein
MGSDQLIESQEIYVCNWRGCGRESDTKFYDNGLGRNKERRSAGVPSPVEVAN